MNKFTYFILQTLKVCNINCSKPYSPVSNNSPPTAINFPDFVLQIFQRSLKQIVLFVKL